MSFWTYISGTIGVSPMGRTQPEKRYILDTVLSHLPLVTGSEGNLQTYVIQKNGHNQSCSHDEFGQWSNLGNGYNYNSGHPVFELQDNYIIVVDASLRDRHFNETLKEFNNWLCRLSKRVMVDDVLVRIDGYDKHLILQNTDDVYGQMFEEPSWGGSTEPTWSEYLMYSKAKQSEFPMLLAYKYYSDNENDVEVERRINYERE